MRVTLFTALFAILAAPDFRGCGGDDDDLPADGTPLPMGEGCATDADCAMMCMDVRCLAGACMVVGPARDFDGDGVAPPPCGDDCDDTLADTFASAPELCDGRDNDCDSTIDEGAPRLDVAYQLRIGDPTSIVLPWGPSFLITELSGSALFGVPVALDGMAGAPIELARLTMGSRFVRVAGAAASDGRLLVMTVTDLGVVRWVVIQRDPATGDAQRLMGPATMPAPPDVSSLEVIAFGAGWAIAYDGTTTFGLERLVTLDPVAEPVIHLPITTGVPPAMGFATDGTHVVLTDEAANIVFFQPDGTEAGRHTVATGRLGARPLASNLGTVIVAMGDAFDYVLAHVELTTGFGREAPAPFGEPDDLVHIATADDVVIVARVPSFGTARIQGILASDLETYVGSGLTFGRGGSDEITRFSVAGSGGPIAALGGLGSGMGSDLGVLEACAGGS